MTRDEAGAVFGYVESGEVRLPKQGEFFLRPEGTLDLAANDFRHESNRMLRPLIRGRDVVVDTKMLERLREACVYADRNHANLSACRDRLWGATRALLASLPPAAPEDPLESDEFFDLLYALVDARGAKSVAAVNSIQEYLRKHAAGIAAAAKEAT